MAVGTRNIVAEMSRLGLDCADAVRLTDEQSDRRTFYATLYAAAFIDIAPLLGRELRAKPQDRRRCYDLAVLLYEMVDALAERKRSYPATISVPHYRLRAMLGELSRLIRSASFRESGRSQEVGNGQAALENRGSQNRGLVAERPESPIRPES